MQVYKNVVVVYTTLSRAAHPCPIMFDLAIFPPISVTFVNLRCQFFEARRGTKAHFADLAARSITGCATRPGTVTHCATITFAKCTNQPQVKLAAKN